MNQVDQYKNTSQGYYGSMSKFKLILRFGYNFTCQLKDAKEVGITVRSAFVSQRKSVIERNMEHFAFISVLVNILILSNSEALKSKLDTNSIGDGFICIPL